MTDAPFTIHLNEEELEFLHYALDNMCLIVSHDSEKLRVSLRDMLHRMRLRKYIYDCGRGQGSVMARSLDEALRLARYDCGLNDPPRNVRIPTAEEEAWREAMGGD